MNRDVRIRIVRNIVDEINSTREYPVLALAGIEPQWKRGNGSIKRTDVNIATLAVNIQASRFLVGCDGVKRGINQYLKATLPFNSQNSQNERYACADSEIQRVIEYYASIKV